MLNIGYRFLLSNSRKFFTMFEFTDAMPTYLFTYVAGGAGHVGRSLAIANYLRDMDPNSRIVFAGAKIGEKLVKEYGFEYIELETPDYFQYGSPNMHAWDIFKIYWKNLRRYLLTFDRIKPDVAVCDMEPLLIFMLRFRGFTTVIITHEMISLWVKDISPVAKKIRDWMRYNMYRCAHKIIYSNIMGIDGIPERLKERTIVVGPLAYEKYRPVSLEGRKKILVVPSNTGDYTEEFIRALKDGDNMVYIRSRTNSRDKKRQNIRFLPPVKNLMSYICSADIILCSGYSTIMEAVACGKPIVIYPKTEEQRIVGKLCEDNGLALYSETQEGVLKHIDFLFKEDGLRKKMVERQKIFPNGAMEAAQSIRDLTENRGNKYQKVS